MAFPTLHQASRRLRKTNAAAGGGYSAAVLADSPVGYWRLGEASGTNAADGSGNGLSATYNGVPTLGVTGALAGDSDTAVTFGSNLYADVNSPASLRLTGNVSVEAWVYPTAAGSFSAVAGVAGSYTYGATKYMLAYGGSPRRAEFTSNGTTCVTDIADELAQNAWSHVVGTWDGSNMNLYINGSLKKTVAQTVAPSYGGSEPFQISRWGGGSSSGFPGSIDEVAVYNTALSGARILAHYNAGI